MKNILLIGGAGYVGTSMMKEYIPNNKISKINCLDRLIYTNQKFDNKIFNTKKIKFIKGDFRNLKTIKKSLINMTDVIILGGLVGDPITKKYRKLSYSINYLGVKKLLNFLSKENKINKVIFVSTCSNYGIVKNKLADENTKLLPKSAYAKAKVDIEKFILKHKKMKPCPVVLRFSTAFGQAPRMRYDLTINEFCKYASNEEKLIVYDPETWRPYCHVKDFSRIVLKVLTSPNKLVRNQVFNVGSNKSNFRKKDIVKLIKKEKKKLKVVFLKKKVDPRDYRVNFSKLKKILKISPSYSAMMGIKEMIKSLNLTNKLSKDIGNYKIKKNVK